MKRKFNKYFLFIVVLIVFVSTWAECEQMKANDEIVTQSKKLGIYIIGQTVCDVEYSRKQAGTVIGFIGIAVASGDDKKRAEELNPKLAGFNIQDNLRQELINGLRVNNKREIIQIDWQSMKIPQKGKFYTKEECLQIGKRLGIDEILQIEVGEYCIRWCGLYGTKAVLSCKWRLTDTKQGKILVDDRSGLQGDKSTYEELACGDGEFLKNQFTKLSTDIKKDILSSLENINDKIKISGVSTLNTDRKSKLSGRR